MRRLLCGAAACTTTFEMPDADTSRDQEVADRIWRHFLTEHREGPAYLTNLLKQDDGGQDLIARIVYKTPLIRSLTSEPS